MGPKRRGRPKKVIAGGSRRDAAFDAMRPYGFEDDMIGTTLDELLEVYDEAWLFIEDCSYHVLREALLAKSDPTTEAGNQIEAITETGVGATDKGNVERPLTIQSSVGNVGSQEEPFVEEEGDRGTKALKHAPVGEVSVVQSNHATIGDLVVSTEADDGCPIGYLTDTGAAEPSSMILPSPALKGSCEDGSNEVSVEHLSVVPISEGNDANPFGDGVEQNDKPLESSDEHVPDSKPAKCGESSGSKYMHLGVGDQNGSVHPRSSSQPLPAPLRRRKRREREPCYGWLSDDESDEEDYKEHHILQLKPSPLQQSPQRKRIQLEQSSIVSTRSDGGCPVGQIIMDMSAVVPSGLILQDSNASSASERFSFGGVKLQCDKSPKPLSRDEFANPLLVEDGASSGSQDMDLEDNDRFVSERPISSGQPPLSTILRLH